jgi:hypothetical protein
MAQPESETRTNADLTRGRGKIEELMTRGEIVERGVTRL